MKSLLLALSMSLAVPTVAFARDFSTVEAKDTAGLPAEVKSTLVSGLKLIREGKFDSFMNTLCSKESLCINANSRSSLTRYNLPAMQRRAERGCLKAGDQIEVTRHEDAGNGEKKVFLQCESTAMPVPFYLKEEGGKWVFTRI